MRTWVVWFEDLGTVDHLESLGILSHKPLFMKELKIVFIKTDMKEEEILNIKGITDCREPSVGTVQV
ncbi:hypothetical protein QTG56_24980 (plasmid) [Rossellomorea sp. AcN35-11]|nr:hypothetical protein [Rossellomorea aquimaris]WJV31888.1 hypothetical protein QTG56_24980 [Rossellomorea sp. AcN35-11]